jgi:hypothetical protein
MEVAGGNDIGNFAESIDFGLKSCVRFARAV